MFAGRKRRKPAHKGAKPVPAEGAKSNPSKRHRDRLNSELERLAGLLPFPRDVVASLDKLSILRLSVSYLRTKSFFSVTLKNQLSDGTSESTDPGGDRGNSAGSVESPVPEGELLLQALNGFVLVVTAEGIIFFCSHTIQDYLGFHQTDVMHQSVFELVHTEDQQEFRRNLHWALSPPSDLGPPADPPADGESVALSSCLVTYNPDQLPPENSSFLDRSFVCRFRCLLDNSSGFLALNIQGRLKFLHGQIGQRRDNGGGAPPQPALFAIATPLQPPAILEIRSRNMIFRTKHKLDFTPMACDAKGKIVLGYTEAELRVRGSGYQFIHAADMLYCAENHVRMIKTGESGLTVFRLLTKENRWKWVQANARLVYKNGRPDYIIATQRPLLEEEGGEYLRKRSMHLPFTFATGEALLYQTSYPLHGFPDAFKGKAKRSKSKKGKADKSRSEDPDPKSLLGALMSQDSSVYVSQPDPEPVVSYHSGVFSQQKSDIDGFGGDGWRVVPNREAGRCSSRLSSYDPLLATLDSLSLDGDETCSNSELFSALENLGLNAEDLELLLLDKRMMQVELDPSHIPTLSDLLTNNEILTYIHSSLESGTEGPGQGDQGGFGPSVHLPNSDPAQSVSQQAALTPAAPPAPPIIQLSQQMQQHISAGKLRHTLSVSQPGPVDNNILPGIPDSPWTVETKNHHPANSSHSHHHPHAVLKASQWNGQQKHFHSLLESSPQWQQDQNSVHVQSRQKFGSQDGLLPGFKDDFGMMTQESAFGPNVDIGPAEYRISSTHAGAGHYQSVMTPSLSYQLQGDQQRYGPVLPACVPTQSSVLDSEQLLGLSQPQQDYGMFRTSMEETAHSKLENVLGPAHAAYIQSCLMPRGSGVAAGSCGAMKEFLFLLLLVTDAASRSHSSWCDTGCECRADLKYTICSRAGFTQLPTRVSPTTELLDLSDNGISAIPERAFSKNRKLQVLLLQNNNISVVEDGGFSQLEFLKRLDLSWNRISTLTEGFSVGLAFLQELQLAHNRLTSLDSRSFLHMDGLLKLNLTSNTIHTIQVRSFSSMSSLRQLHLEDNRLTSLRNGMFSMLRSLEVLNLAGNRIGETEVGIFKPLTSMTLLSLANNQLSTIYFKTFLSIHTYSTHVLLKGNPWNCDCDLQRVFRKLRSIQRLFLDDYYNLTCKAPPVLQNYRLMEVDTELCIAETVTVLIITATVVITVVAAMLMGERMRRKEQKGKHWTQQAELSDESDY
ncbi:hypothetical protein Q5P01_005872 [Channa striata]|uniref:Aryl hydrocarbon receptor n=1 Tax=Channa striata TaxID=64152 RepID=A0AA88NH66_CHASR|nr:hypothetical protein Q5P01_005872 [Channa striata]